MVEVRGLSKRFGRLSVLNGIDLAIATNRVTAIVGPNAAGKTTLIKTILGLIRPDAGTVLVDGKDIRDEVAYRSNIGYMPQIARFPENMSANDLFGMLTDLRGSEARTDKRLVDAFGLSAELSKPLKTLSGGTRQKVNAAMAFLFAPQLLILDEPTAGLDPVASGVLKARISEDRSNGTTFILTSHIMSELEELADDVVFLHDGRIDFVGPVEEIKSLTSQTNLERAIAAMMQRGRAA
jgi:Cu-processing system ATP-binding protein